MLLAIDAVAVLLHSIAHIADRLQPAASKDSPLAKAAPIAPLGTPEISESPEVAPALSPRESAECSHLSGPFQTPRTTVRRSHDAGASTGGGPAADTAAARSRQARRVQESLAAQEHIWAALAPVTEETCRLLLETVWPSALEVRALRTVVLRIPSLCLPTHRAVPMEHRKRRVCGASSCEGSEGKGNDFFWMAGAKHCSCACRHSQRSSKQSAARRSRCTSFALCNRSPPSRASLA